jgi:hypothetical protein
MDVLIDVLTPPDWRGWVVEILFLWFVGWLLWRWLSALVFQYFLLGGMLRRYGWQAEHPDNSGAYAEYKQQMRQQRGQNWAYMREHGWRGVKDVAKGGDAKFRVPKQVRADVSITGMFNGRTFVAAQKWYYEYTSGGPTSSSGTSTRRTTVLELHVLPTEAFDAANALPRFEVRTRLLTGKARGAPPGLEQVLRSRRFRWMRCDGAMLLVRLGPRLRRGPLLAGLNHLSAVADRLRPN